MDETPAEAENLFVVQVIYKWSILIQQSPTA